MAGMGDMLGTLGALLPPWALALLLGVVLVIAFPFWLQSTRSRQIGSRARRMVRSEGEQRQALLKEILGLAGSRPTLLASAAENALKYGVHDLRAAAIEELERVGAQKELAFFREKLGKEVKPFGHPVEASVAIERLLRQGMFDTARERLAEAQQKWPSDPDLEEISRRIWR